MICPGNGIMCDCDTMNWNICAPVGTDPRLSITADEFAAMVKDAERWRKFCGLDADVYINSTGEVFAGEGFCQVLAQYLDAMEKE